MATHNLAVIIKNPLAISEFLLVRQTPPPKYNHPEYDTFVDSHLWDLPSVHFTPLQNSEGLVQSNHSSQEKLNFCESDISFALTQVLEQLGLGEVHDVEWDFCKCIEEPEFGPGLPIKTVYIMWNLGPHDEKLNDTCRWMSTKSCMDLLLEVKPGSDRIGPLVVLGLINNSMHNENLAIPPTLRIQEYPPGVKLVPMGSRTAKPFKTTNLVIFSPESNHDADCDNSSIIHGDALIVDPGCKSTLHKELREIVAALPRNLVVFVTHHHRDHVDGLSVVQLCNRNARLLVHQNTMSRIKKDDWSLTYISVSGSEEICIGGQILRIISAQGHTDGHLGLLHVSTNSLIVGDHCVGQGSALLDSTSGGNMSDYFQTTYRFMELSPHVLISMHGRANSWPKHMLCGYLKNRRIRESTILKAIEDGATTLFDIVSSAYAEVDHSLWIHAASNVRLHVDHLVSQDKLPKDFSLEKFNWSFAEFAGKMGKL